MSSALAGALRLSRWLSKIFYLDFIMFILLSLLLVGDPIFFRWPIEWIFGIGELPSFSILFEDYFSFEDLLSKWLWLRSWRMLKDVGLEWKSKLWLFLPWGVITALCLSINIVLSSWTCFWFFLFPHLNGTLAVSRNRDLVDSNPEFNL